MTKITHSLVRNNMFGNLFHSRQNRKQELKEEVIDTDGMDKNIVASSLRPDRRSDLSVLTSLDARANSVLQHAEQEAKRIKQPHIESKQLLFGLLFDTEIFQLCSQFSVDIAKLSHELQQNVKEGSFERRPTLSEDAKRVFEQAHMFAKNRGASFVTPEDLLIALFSTQVEAAKLLESLGITQKQVEEKLSQLGVFAVGKKSVLERFGVDLTDQARQGLLDPVVGRDKEIERLIHILLRRTKNNPIIIGAAGVGKTAIVEGMAKAIVEGSAPKDFLEKRIIQLDISSLIAGATHRGEFEERLRDVIKEVQIAEGQVILFVDEIHTLIGTGDTEGALDASNIIKPFIARGKLQIIGATTTAEYRKYFEKDKAFERRFQPILVEEPSEEIAFEMLKILQSKYENFHKVKISDEAVKQAVHLSKKYIGQRFLPDKAVDLLDEAAAQVHLKHTEGKRANNQVERSDIESVVSSWTGIPVTRLTEDESEKLLNLEKIIHQRLINQETAVTAVAEAVRRGRIGLAAINRPIASFIFLGPTGVGKTELAKTLGEILFGKEELMTRLDMSEYMEKHEVAKLIGAPPGYVGYEEGGQLTEAVRTKPYSIILLDEIEKAHPDVFNILLQILEDGRLTDNKGDTISFKNTIIIATSNIGSVLIQQQLQSASQPQELDGTIKMQELQKIVLGELKKFFRPELLNRFDEVVIFEPLSRENMHAIAKLTMEHTAKLLKEQGITLTVSDGAYLKLAKEGYDPVYGARPLRRIIQTAIENPIALLLIQKKFIAGDVVMLDYNPNTQAFVFAKKELPNSQQVDPGLQTY